MSEGTRSHNSFGFIVPWKPWYETYSSMWTKMLNGYNQLFIDPFGLYRTWLKSMGNVQQQMKEKSSIMLDPTEAWKQWLGATSEYWRKTAEAEGDTLGLTNQWLATLAEAQSRMLANGEIPSDPFTFFKQWYDATSEAWAKIIGDVIGSENFLDASSNFFDNYSRYAKFFQSTSEEYFKNLQLPTRPDLARVAELVIALEEKFDSMEDAFEEFQENFANVATKQVVEDLTEHLKRLETKLNVRPTPPDEIDPLENLTRRLEKVENKLENILDMLRKIQTKSTSQKVTTG